MCFRQLIESKSKAGSKKYLELGKSPTTAVDIQSAIPTQRRGKFKGLGARVLSLRILPHPIQIFSLAHLQNLYGRLFYDNQ